MAEGKIEFKKRKNKFVIRDGERKIKSTVPEEGKNKCCCNRPIVYWRWRTPWIYGDGEGKI